MQTSSIMCSLVPHRSRNHDKEHLRELLPNTRLYNFYGTTESGCSCILDFNAMPDKKTASENRPAMQNLSFDEQGNAIDATEETLAFSPAAEP